MTKKSKARISKIDARLDAEFYKRSKYNNDNSTTPRGEEVRFMLHDAFGAAHMMSARTS